MIRLVCYDIEDDKVRNKVSKYLLRRGFERIQKSVFMGECNSGKWIGVEKALHNLAEGVEGTLDIHAFIMEEGVVFDMFSIGNRPDLEYICGRKRVIFF